MALELLDHYSIRTAKLEQTRAFYVEVLGLTEGYRPTFDFPGHWLYCGSRAVVHLIGANAEGTTAFLGERDVSASNSTGALDHIAFRATDLKTMHGTLEARQIQRKERTIPDLDLHLVFIEDPNGITIELNYVAGEV